MLQKLSWSPRTKSHGISHNVDHITLSLRACLVCKSHNPNTHFSVDAVCVVLYASQMGARTEPTRIATRTERKHASRRRMTMSIPGSASYIIRSDSSQCVRQQWCTHIQIYIRSYVHMCLFSNASTCRSRRKCCVVAACSNTVRVRFL